MNILLLNYEYPPLGGGAGVISRHIAEGLADLSHSVTVVTTWFSGENEYFEEKEGRLRIIRLTSKRKYTYRSNIREMNSWIIESKKFLTVHLKQNVYDITFANFSLPGGEVASFVRNISRIPYVIISHGHDIPWFFPKQMFFYHLITYFWIRMICNKASAIFVQSGDMMNNAIRFIGKKSSGKVKLIHNGADYYMFFSDGSPRSEKFRILFVGRLVKQKGPIVFLEAMKKLADAEIPFEAKVFGDGPMRKQMESFVKANKLEKNIFFRGWISKEAIALEYRSAHVMVAPSLNEGMSMALNEALASGLYVMTTPVSCNETLIKDNINGEIFPSGNLSELAHRLKRYYSEKFLINFRVPEDEIIRFHKEYNWEYIALEYERVLLDILKSRNAKNIKNNKKALGIF